QKDTRKASSLKTAHNRNQTADALELQKGCASRTHQISGSDQEATEKKKLANVPESESVSGFTTDKEDSSNSTVDKDAGNLPANVGKGDSSLLGVADSHLRAKGPTQSAEKGGGSKESKVDDKGRGHTSKVVGKDKREEPNVRRSKSLSSTVSESGISVLDKLGNGIKQRHKESESDKKKEKHEVPKLGRDMATTEKMDKKATTDEVTKQAEKAKPRISSSKPDKKSHKKTATAKTNNSKAPDNVTASTSGATIQSSPMALPSSAKSTLEQISAKHNTEHGNKSSTKKLTSETSKKVKKLSKSPSRQALAAEKSGAEEGGTEKKNAENSSTEDIAGASDPVTSSEKERKEKGLEKHNKAKEVHTHLTAAKLPTALDSAARNSKVSESTGQPTTSTSGPKQTKRGSVRKKNKLSMDPFENVQHCDNSEATCSSEADASKSVASKGSASKVNATKTNASEANVSKTNLPEGMVSKQNTSKAKISIAKAVNSVAITPKNIVAAEQLSQGARTSS
ncbi:suppressor protein SRP40, putative, partial [Ixodes scapularis]